MNSPATRLGSARSTGICAPASAPRAAIYLRVSTGRQAEHDLSIPDQRAQTQAWVAQRGWTVVAEYIEPGASATDDKRPEFQKMIERACDGENAFDVDRRALVLALLPRRLRPRVLRAQARQAWRQAGVDHAGAGRRPGPGDDAAGDCAVRRIPVEGERQARAALDEGECPAGVLERLTSAARLHGRRGRAARQRGSRRSSPSIRSRPRPSG